MLERLCRSVWEKIRDVEVNEGGNASHIKASDASVLDRWGRLSAGNYSAVHFKYLTTPRVQSLSLQDGILPKIYEHHDYLE